MTDVGNIAQSPVSQGPVLQVPTGVAAQLQANVATDQAALQANDLTALQAAQAVLANPASTPDDITAALTLLPSAVGDAGRTARANQLLNQWQAQQARVLAIMTAELAGMVTLAQGEGS